MYTIKNILLRNQEWNDSNTFQMEFTSAWTSSVRAEQLLSV